MPFEQEDMRRLAEVLRCELVGASTAPAAKQGPAPAPKKGESRRIPWQLVFVPLAIILVAVALVLINTLQVNPPAISSLVVTDCPAAGVIQASDAKNHLNEQATVRFTVDNVNPHNGAIYLNAHGRGVFAAVIYNLIDSTRERYYNHVQSREIAVRGTVQPKDSGPQITIKDADSLKNIWVCK